LLKALAKLGAASSWKKNVNGKLIMHLKSRNVKLLVLVIYLEKFINAYPLSGTSLKHDQILLKLL